MLCEQLVVYLSDENKETDEANVGVCSCQEPSNYFHHENQERLPCQEEKGVSTHLQSGLKARHFKDKHHIISLHILHLGQVISNFRPVNLFMDCSTKGVQEL